jgi:hypothetical protein
MVRGPTSGALPDEHHLRLERTERRRVGDLGSVPTGSDPHKAIKMRLADRVEEPPTPVQVGFKDSVEIRRHP